ncbi:uncharacterized protein At1g05835 [Aristolochia californica]|uniref:uncharacterized protein At1g05835 n=1 Tax=Aristolochia californica TaxID=171875 RepID=UPI0035E3AF63
MRAPARLTEQKPLFVYQSPHGNLILLCASAMAALKILFWIVAASYLLHHGRSARCGANQPSVRQIQVGFGQPPKYDVQVMNNCATCPAINIHINCGGFPQVLVDPKVFKVLKYDDCIVNGGLPLAPLQKISFNYSHNKFTMSPKTWFFQCE